MKKKKAKNQWSNFNLKKLQKEEQLKPNEIQEGNKMQVKKKITKKTKYLQLDDKEIQYFKICRVQLKQCLEKKCF